MMCSLLKQIILKNLQEVSDDGVVVVCSYNEVYDTIFIVYQLFSTIIYFFKREFLILLEYVVYEILS